MIQQHRYIVDAFCTEIGNIFASMVSFSSLLEIDVSKNVDGMWYIHKILEIILRRHCENYAELFLNSILNPFQWDFFVRKVKDNLKALEIVLILAFNSKIKP